MRDTTTAERLSNLNRYAEEARMVEDLREQLRAGEQRLLRAIRTLGSDPLSMGPMWSSEELEESVVRLPAGRRAG